MDLYIIIGRFQVMHFVDGNDLNFITGLYHNALVLLWALGCSIQQVAGVIGRYRGIAFI